MAASGELRARAHWLTRSPPLLVVGLAAVFALRRLANTDTWWHLASGRWIVTHKSIPRLDTLSWTVPDHPWINLQWLFDVAAYLIFSLGGPALLVASSALVYAAATALMVANVRRHLGPVASALLCAWAVLISQVRFEIRPEMVSYLLLQVLLWLYATGRTPDSRRLWAVPAVMCLWVNSHSLFILGVFIVVCQLAGGLAADLAILPAGWRQPIAPAARRRLFATGAAALAATLINPFFIDGTLFPFKLMSRINGDNPVFQQIGEFRRPFESTDFSLSLVAYRWFFFFTVAVVLAAAVVAALRPEPRARRAPRAGPLDPAVIAALAGIAYLSLLARRNISLLALGGAPGVAACLALLAARVPEAVHAVLTRLRGLVAAAVLALALGGGWFVASNGFYLWNNELREFGLGQLDVKFPVGAAAFIKTQGLPGRLYNDLGTGGYLAWADPIPGGVYIDGRLEVYDTDFFGRYTRLAADPRAWQAEMDRLGVQTVLQFHLTGTRRNLLHYLLTDGRWALVYYDETSVVLLRRAGNEHLIPRALAAFAAARAARERSLLEPVPSWQRPVGRIYALKFYSSFLEAIGRVRDAQRFRSAGALLAAQPAE